MNAPTEREAIDLRLCILEALLVGVSICGGRISDAQCSLWPAEMQAIQRAGSKRLAEFTAGRTYARMALRELGFRDEAIPVGANRQPLWDRTRVTGAISHTDHLCYALVAKVDDSAAIGFDLARNQSLAHDVRALILAGQMPPPAVDGIDPGLLVLTMKEAFFKAYFPLTQCFLEPEHIRIDLDAERSTFVANLVSPDRPPLLDRRRWSGWFGSRHQHVWAFLPVARQESFET